MKTRIITALAVTAILVGCGKEGIEHTDINSSGEGIYTDIKRVSYGMGIGLGERLGNDSFNIDVKYFTQGILDAINKSERIMTQEEIVVAMNNFQEETIANKKAEDAQLAASNMKLGNEFIDGNRYQSGVTTTDTGLQYKVITIGTGEKPSSTDTVEVNYKGTLIDGTEFDSSYRIGQSITFPVRAVIKGWQEGLQLMNVGAKWRLFIPADLAYGEQSAGDGIIGPNSTLIFEVELLSIKGGQHGR